MAAAYLRISAQHPAVVGVKAVSRAKEREKGVSRLLHAYPKL